MLSGHYLVIAFRRCQIARRCYEFFGERLVVEKYPRVLCFAISLEHVFERGGEPDISYSI
jgi:hypothetical protein